MVIAQEKTQGKKKYMWFAENSSKQPTLTKY